MVYTPQQNGVVERKHRHLLETARALKLHANFPNCFWGNCILAATYIINKMPMKILYWKSPFEVLYGKVRTYDNLRVIGFLCYAAVTTPHKDKFGPKGIPCVFIGYPQNQKGYRLYDLNNKTVFCSRNVVFKEHMFPFKQESEPPIPASTLFPTPNNLTDDEDFPNIFQSSSEPTTPEHITLGHIIPEPPTPPLEPNDNEMPSNIPSPIPDVQIPHVSLKRSQRNTSNPAWMKDFVLPKHTASTVSQLTKQPLYPIFNASDFARLPESHVTFITNVLTHTEPSSYHQACQHPQWVAAMDSELNALEKNETWDLTVLPACCKAITSKWVYKIKYNLDGTVDKFKARLVIRGFYQKEGVDYKHTFSHVAKLATVRVLIAIATAKGWPSHQLDVNNAFLHDFIDGDIYMKPPEGYSTLRSLVFM